MAMNINMRIKGKMPIKYASVIVLFIILFSCNDKNDKLLNNNDCWVYVSNGRDNYSRGTYSSAESFYKDRGYFLNFGFEDSSVSFKQPRLYDGTPKTIYDCSFQWEIKGDSLCYYYNDGKSLSYKIEKLTKDTLLLRGNKKTVFMHVRFPIKDTSFIPADGRID